jgi:hypothetical protein
MSKFSFLPAAAAVFAAASLLAPAGASADVYVYRPGPIILAPAPLLAPPVYVAPAAPVCTTRFVGVWVNGVYTHRAVRACY